MLRAARLSNLQYLILYVLAFVLSFSFYYAAVSIVLLTLVWLFSTDYKELIGNIKDRKVVLAFVGYYLLFAISYFYSTDKAQASFDLQTKTSLLLLPVVIGAGMNLKKEHIEKVFFSFVLGITTSAIISIARAYFEWKATNNTEVFFYHNLVSQYDTNAVYVALYSFFSIGLLLFYNWETFFRKQFIIVRVALLALQLGYFLLLSSRMLILLMLVFMIPYFLFRFLNQRLSRLQLSVLTLSIVLAFASIFAFDNPVRDRFEELFNKDFSIVTLDDYSNIKEASFSNVTLRLFLWRLGIENVNEKKLWLTGAGSGDAQKLQNEKLREYNFPNIDEEPVLRTPIFNANLHNMFLQTLLMVGIPGVIFLLIIFFTPFYHINKLAIQPWFVVFHISSFFFMMQESMLQTQAGTVYYTLFYSIFIVGFYIKKI